MKRESTTKADRDADDTAVLNVLRKGPASMWHVGENTPIGDKRVSKAIQRLKKAGKVERLTGTKTWKEVA